MKHGVECVARRRHYVKHLQRSAKSLLLVVGLESLVDKLDDHKPIAETAADGVDWSPSESCALCEESAMMAVDTPPPLPPPVTKTSSSTPSSSSTSSPSSVFSMLMAMPRMQQQLMYMHMLMAQQHSMASINGEAPLDLSKKDMGNGTPTVDESKRPYGQSEMEAAIADIRAGKLGTRRASVVYGIPRSTLRNKIYKMDTETTTGVKRSRGTISRASETESELSSEEGKSSFDPIEAIIGSVINSGRADDDSDLSSTTEVVVGGAKLDPRVARPKRGQYRKYDKHSLEMAVTAVRLGTMSVHRAGTFYGVPHSTLEYKVKERVLPVDESPVVVGDVIVGDVIVGDVTRPSRTSTPTTTNVVDTIEEPSFWQQLPAFFAGFKTVTPP